MIRASTVHPVVTGPISYSGHAELQRDIDTEYEAISLKAVTMQVSLTRELGLVILDACRNNPFAASMKRLSTTRSTVSRGFARIEPSDNVLVAYAAKDGTTASDGNGRNSPFTAANDPSAPVNSPFTVANSPFHNCEHPVHYWNETFTTTVPYASTHATAEWIEETPLIIGTNAGLASLPNLTDPAFDLGTTNGAPANLKASEEMQLTDSNGSVIGSPSAPDSDLDGFGACTWATSCAAPGS